MSCLFDVNVNHEAIRNTSVCVGSCVMFLVKPVDGRWTQVSVKTDRQELLISGAVLSSFLSFLSCRVLDDVSKFRCPKRLKHKTAETRVCGSGGTFHTQQINQIKAGPEKLAPTRFDDGSVPVLCRRVPSSLLSFASAVESGGFC